MKKDEIINKNLERLARLGLMVIGDSHTINRNMGIISGIIGNAIKNKKELPLKSLEIIQENLEGIRFAFAEMKRVQYQREREIKWVSLKEAAKKMQKFWGEEYLELEIKKDCSVYITLGALYQSIINIVDNALYIPFDERDYKDGGKHRNKCKLTVDGNKIIISDDGKGVDESIKDKIFDFCFTGKPVNHKSDIKGIGLFIVKQHSEAFNFDIAVENNTILKGANFTLTFNNFQEI